MKILYVTSSEPQRTTTGAVLRQAGYEVCEAASSGEALEQLARARPDLVVLSGPLPDGTVNELCRLVKSASAATPFVIQLTGADAAPGDPESPADLFLSTSIAAADLAAVVDLCLQTRRHAVSEEHRVKDEKARLSEIIEATSDLVATSDGSGRLTYMNRAGRKLCGRENMPVVGTSIADYHAPAVYQFIAQHAMPEALEHGIWRGENWMRRPDGTEFPVSQVILVHRDAAGEIAFMATVIRDMTEHYRSEAERKQLAEIIEATSDLVAITDLSGHVTYMNRAGRSVLGLAENEPLEHRTIPDYHPPWAYEIVAKQGIPSALEHGLWRADTALRKRDGSEFPVSQVLIVHRSRDGKPQSISTIARDITQHQLAEKALGAQRKLLRSILDTAPTVFYLFDIVERRDLEVSQRAADILGYGSEDLACAGEKAFLALMHPEDQQRFEHHLATVRRARDGEVLEFEYRMRHRNGDWRWLLSRDTVFARSETGAVRQLLGIAMDITERKEAELMLALSEERFRTLSDAPVLLWIMGPDGQLQFTNQECATFTGHSFYQLRERQWEGLLHPEDLATYVRTRELALQHRERFEIDFRARRADGVYRWMRTLGVPRMSADGALLGYVGCTLDIHDRKLAEDALCAADRRKDEFLAMLAHELRNPLMPIRHALELQEEIQQGDPRWEWARKLIARQVDHLARLVEDLVDVSGAVLGRMVLRKEAVDVATVLDEASEASRPLIDSRGHRFSVSPPEEPLKVDGDPVRLVQVVENLLSNAAHYTPDGGEIVVTARREGDEAVIGVKDTGQGMSPGLISRVFDLFTQGERALYRDPGGLGIGLTIVRKIAELHQGRVEAHSEGPGHGSEFRVYQPLSAGNANAEISQRVGTSVASGASVPRRILVIEDNRDTADSLALLLRLHRHDVELARDGGAALETARSFQPDVVVLDIGLPGMDGYEVAQRLRAMPETRHALLIALTGYGSRDDRDRAKQAGIDHYLVKPVKMGILNDLLSGRSGFSLLRPGRHDRARHRVADVHGCNNLSAAGHQDTTGDD